MKPWNVALVLIAVSLPLSCAAPGVSSAEPKDPLPAPDAQEKMQALRDFGAAYEYNTDYMEALLEMSPEGYATFEAAMGMGEYREHLSLDAHHVARISALLGDDCGACTQLGLRLAVEAGVRREILQQLLSEPESLPELLKLVHEYAFEVGKGNNASLELVGQLREALGDQGFAELSVNVVGIGIYPALRRAIGAETVCPDPSLDF